MKVLFTTSLPSPYQVELFDALAADGSFDITVLYSMRMHKSRSWKESTLNHAHHFLGEESIEEERRLFQAQNIVVLSGYQPMRLRHLIKDYSDNGGRWAFWGEKPGFLLPVWLGKLYRRAVIPQLFSHKVAIWGMGGWAVTAYQDEYGVHRKTFNIPYFSNLSPFLLIDRNNAISKPTRILFSGSLIERKGVDLLMKAFVAVADEFPLLELHLIGEGPLRKRLDLIGAPVAHRIHFHGFRQWGELPTYYAAADILCAPSRHDGWGLIIPEGLASGLLVISTNQTGAALDLIDENCGWVIEGGSLPALTEAIRFAAMTNGAERIERIERGRQSAIRQDLAAGVTRVSKAIRESYSHSL